MAKVHLEYDTKDKSLNAKMDGKAMANVHRASFYSNGKDRDGKHRFSGEIAMHQHDKDEDVHHMQSVCASEKEGDCGLTITFVRAETPLQSAVAKYFGVE